jgi:tetratricopeptide (TPR) repeat protein
MGERGSYQLARASQKLDIPATAKAIVAARIDRLDAEHKRLLQAAAVIGKDVPFALLENIAELSDEDLRRGLSNLQGSEYLYEARLFPDLEYTFKHALTHEVAYGSLLHDRRRKLHGQIVEAIEQLYSDRMAERINQLADHAFRGELWEKAVTYLRQAGSRALTRSAYREAATYFENALTALTHLPENKSTLELAIDLRFDLRNALWPLGEFEKLLGILREAERLAKELDDARRLGWIAVYMSANLWITGRPAEARLDGQNALTIGESLDELPIQIAAEFYLGVTCATSGEYRLSTEPLLKIVKRLEGDKAAERCGLPFYPSVLARSWLVWSLAECGEFAEGIGFGEEGIRMAEIYDHPYSLAHICYDLGYLYTIQGEAAAAVSILERGFAIMEEWNLSFLRPLLTWFLGHARVRSGQVADGLPLLETSEKVFRSMGSGAFQALNLVHLGEALVLANRADDALRAAQEALAFSRARGQRSYEAYSLCLLGQLASQGPSLEFETADAHYQAAITLTSELGMLPLLAHCHQQLGRLYLQNGQLPSQEHLANATMLYRKMSMQAGGAQ